jgi:hyaluronoglucosaminidase
MMRGQANTAKQAATRPTAGERGAGPPGRTMTRRRFLVGTAAIGLGATGLGAILSSCEAVVPSGSPARASIVPGSPFSGTPPTIDPAPRTASYGDLLSMSALMAVDVPSAPLRALLGEVAADARMPISAAPEDGRGQARLTIRTDDSSLSSQAYRLEVTPTTDGPGITIRASDEAGAHYGLVSLAQLFVPGQAGGWLRVASVLDQPGMARRGAILDPWVMEAGGPTAASRALLLERVRLGVRYKLNFVDLPDRTPWPELTAYCAAHHVEVMVAKGYRDWLSTTPTSEVERILGEVVDAGARSFCLNWDDISTSSPEAVAQQQAAVFRQLHGYLRGRDPGVRVSATLTPYGGVPGGRLVGSAPGDGERYLAVMHDALPDDVEVFWTGDGGVFSPTVTTAGAQAYATAVGHRIGLWDNDTITFSRGHRPCSGRAADLHSVVRSYMGNLAGEAEWSGTSGGLALLTSLAYAWNPGAYDPASAAPAAERVLAAWPSVSGS